MKRELFLVIVLTLVGGIFWVGFGASPTPVPAGVSTGEGSQSIATNDSAGENGPYDDTPGWPVVEGVVDNTGPGNISLITPAADYADDLLLTVYLRNPVNLTEAYRFIHLYLGIWRAEDGHTDLTSADNWTDITTNVEIVGEVDKLSAKDTPSMTFIVNNSYVDHDNPLVVTLEGGKFKCIDSTAEISPIFDTNIQQA